MNKTQNKKAVAISLLLLSVGFSGAALNAAEAQPQKTASRSVISGTVTPDQSGKKEWRPLKVCVMDFDSIDSLGQKRFLDANNAPIVIPEQSEIRDADRKDVDSVMQGLVGMIGALDTMQTNTADREAQVDDNVFSRKKALDLYDTVVKGEARPMVVGAEYLSAFLGRHNDVFSTVDASVVAAAIKKYQKEPDFPQDFMLHVAKETGATHLIYGTVSDLHTKTNSYSGYGIQTNSTTFELDIIVKVVDLIAQKSVYSKVYTGTYWEQRPISAKQFDNNIFQSLMKSALEQAAEDLYDICKEGSSNKISVTPIPYPVTIDVSGGLLFKSSEAEIFVDGSRVASGGETILVPAGKHKLEVKASGYKTRLLDIDVKSEQTIAVKLEK